MVNFFWRWIFRPFLLVIFGQAAFQISHALGYYPDQWLAETVLGLSVEPWANVVAWGTVLLFTVLALWFFEIRRSNTKIARHFFRRQSEQEDPRPSDSGAHKPTSYRIQLIELGNLAVNDGWDFFSAPSLHSLDFLDAIRQAGCDGSVTFHGRKVEGPEALVARNPLVEIPRETWHNHDISLFEFLKNSAAGAQGFVDDNLTVRLRPSNKLVNSGYADIHANREQSTRWLSSEAREFIGKRKPRNSWLSENT